jgi:YcaO-like protein with predicted kinase domain
MGTGSPEIQYELQLIETTAATGYFACVPAAMPDFEQCLAYARSHPNDEFMRKHLLGIISGWGLHTFSERLAAIDHRDDFLRALFLEACLLNPEFSELEPQFPSDDRPALAAQSPLVYLKALLLPDHALHRSWSAVFRQNLVEHRPLPPPDALGLPPPVVADDLAEAGRAPRTTLETMRRDTTAAAPAATAGPDETARLALERLRRAGVVVAEEMRHESSLSPIALLRRWRLDRRVRSGRHHFRVFGEQTAYGRGLDLASARAACTMEIVERRSAFASAADLSLSGYRNTDQLIRCRASDLDNQGLARLDLNRLNLEAPYRDDPLYWICGREQTGGGIRPIWVPAQCVFLFCNFDEVKLFSALGSTGLAAGFTPEAAKASALLEVIERDADGVTPFHPDLCFEAEAADPQIDALLESYRHLGIRVYFQDITPSLGVPCCRCFVVSRQGTVVKGTGAHLDARRSLLAALTETPYPYPGGPPSVPILEGLLRVPLEALPDYSGTSAAGDLVTLETLLSANGFHPVYIDLTREDIGLPVVRALVPGMELLGDFDRFSRVHPRLYANYLQGVRGNK